MTIGSGQPVLAADILKHVNAAGELELAGATEKTIASGAITVDQNYHTVDTQSDASTDDLDTITKQSDMDDGFILVLVPEHTDRTVVIKHNTGNILTEGDADISLDDTGDVVVLMYRSALSKWVQIGGDLGTGAIVGGHIAANAVTSAKLQDGAALAEILDDDGAGSGLDADLLDGSHASAFAVAGHSHGVVGLDNRQGGHATNWFVHGTTNYAPGATRVQAGLAGVSFPSGSTGTVVVTFPATFGGTPLVLVTVDNFAISANNKVIAVVEASGTTSCTIRWRTADGASISPDQLNFVWFAIGPE